MIALEKREPMGDSTRCDPHRPSINVRTSPPEHLAQFTMLDLASSSVFSQLLA